LISPKKPLLIPVPLSTVEISSCTISAGTGDTRKRGATLLGRPQSFKTGERDGKSRPDEIPDDFERGCF
jgi:hypothetical protein